MNKNTQAFREALVFALEKIGRKVQNNARTSNRETFCCYCHLTFKRSYARPSKMVLTDGIHGNMLSQGAEESSLSRKQDNHRLTSLIHEPTARSAVRGY